MEQSRKEGPYGPPTPDGWADSIETIDGRDGLVARPGDAQRSRLVTVEGPAASASSGQPVVTVRSTQIGRFTLLHQLGQGGMGSVYAAYDQQLDRRVALKLLHQRTAGNTLQRQRTLQEARAVARISHPNVIAVYDVGETDEHIYIAMEYVDGQTLTAWQSSDRHSWREILDMYLLAGAGLQAAHAAGVVHRDFKPDNVLCGKDGRLRVADFGLARIAWSDEEKELGLDGAAPADGERPGRLTQHGVISGTPGYMSPEQYRGGNVDARSDQWSYCAALYEALYGYLPFGGETLRERSEQVLGSPLPPPRNVRIPEEVHRAILRGLSTDPDRRFPSMEELLHALALEQGDHAAGRTVTRSRLLSWFVGVAIIAFGWLRLRQGERALSPRDLLVGTGVVLITMLLGGFVFRKTLLDHRFHRSMWLMCVLHMFVNMLQRLMALKLAAPMEWLFPSEMLFMASNAMIIGLFLIPWMRYVAAMPLLAGLLSLWGLAPLRVLTAVYLLIVVAVVIGWSRAARRPPRKVHTERSGTTVLSPSRPPGAIEHS